MTPNELSLKRLQILADHLDRIKDFSSSTLLQHQKCLTSQHQRIVVIGSMVMDVQATPAPGFKLETGGSVPGHVRFIPGGVGRNIAHNLALLTISPLLISAVADDSAGKTLRDAWRGLGMETRGIQIVNDCGATPVVSIIFDGQGDLASAVADVAFLENALTGQVLYSLKNLIKVPDILLLDGNLSKQALEAACNIAKRDNTNTKHPLICFEPVSSPKSTRIMDVLSLVDFISPNMAELEAMARAALLKHNLCLTNTSQLLDRSVPKELQKARPWLQILLQQCSVGNIIVTLGAAGAAVCTLSSDKQYIDIHHAPALPVDRIENTSGAGDCLVAGMMHSLLEKRNNHTDALAAGIAAARQAICSEYNVPPSLNINQLRSDARNVKISFFQFSLY